jgi:chromate transporter
MTRATTPDLIRTFARIGLLSFGGPAGQIALMHRTLVDEKGWLDETRFLHALNFCMLLPGPEAQQLATYTGWLLGGIRGGLIAGLLFVLPGLLAMLCLSWIYVLYGNVPLVEGLFFGLKAAVLAIVVQALLKIAARALNSPQAYLLAVSAFLAIFAFGLPFPVIIAAAALIGILTFRGKTAAPSSAIQTKPFSWWPTLTALILWLLPIAVLLMTLAIAGLADEPVAAD